MERSLLKIFAVIALGYSSISSASFDGNNSMGYSTNIGNYNEYRISGYNIQPNRPGVWDAGCRTDNYYCTAQLERCRGQQGFTYVEPNILKQHR